MLLAASLALGPLVLSGGARTPVGQAVGWILVTGFYGGPLALLVGWIATLFSLSAKDTTILVDREGVTLEPARRTLVRRDAIASGIVVPRAQEWDVELETRSGDLAHLGVADEATADAILAALALDAGQRRTTVRFARFFHRFLLGWAHDRRVCSAAALLIGQFLVAVLHKPDAHIAPMMCAFPLGLLLVGPVNRRFVWTEVSVGLDGLSVQVAFSRRFIPFGDVERAEIYQVRVSGRGGSFLRPAGIELWHGDGRSERVALAPDDAQIRDALLLRVRQALAAGRRPEEPATTLALLARGERSPAQWRRELAELWVHSDYRQLALRRDDVASALEDPGAAREHRLGAALALMACGDPEATAQVRSAADTCADPALRDALAGIAAGEASDEAIAAALRT